jgi:Zn-dependent peptidase ImmA (M78 family)/transcriptional regulator with XRE-family HTH domain
MEKITQINKDILKWAREYAGLSIEEAAKKIGTSEKKVSEWEDGSDHPTFKQLNKIAYQVYKFPSAIFFFPEPPKMKNIKKEFRRLPEFEKDKIDYQMIKIIRAAHGMILNLKELNHGVNRSPKRLLRVNLRVSSNIEKTAKLIREILGVSMETQSNWQDPTEALKQWRKRIQDDGIYVFKEAFRNDAFSGFCLYEEEFPIIYINNSTPKTRQIFTLFHELVHLLLRKNDLEIKDKSYLDFLPDKDLKIEQFCNAVAAETLVPTKDFLEMYQNTLDESSVRKAEILADYFNVSREVVFRKMYEKNKISLEEYQYHRKIINEEYLKSKRSSKKSEGGNYFRNKKVYLGDKYISLVFDSFRRNEIDSFEASKYLEVKVDYLAEIAS